MEKNGIELKQHPYFPQLWVAKNGAVWSEAKARHAASHGNGWLSDQKLKGGYHKVLISIQGDKINLKIHRLVAETWVPNPEGHDIVDHIDRNKDNNDADNLRWVSRSESNTNRRTVRPVECIETGEVFRSTADAAKAYSVSGTAIAAVCKRKKGYRKIAGHGWRYATEGGEQEWTPDETS